MQTLPHPTFFNKKVVPTQKLTSVMAKSLHWMSEAQSVCPLTPMTSQSGRYSAPAQMRKLSLEGLGQGHMVEMVSLGPRRLSAHSSSLCRVITPASTHLLTSRRPTFMDKQVLTDLMSSLPTWLPGGVEISEDRTTGYEKTAQHLAGQEASTIGPCPPAWWGTCLFYFFFFFPLG